MKMDNKFFLDGQWHLVYIPNKKFTNLHKEIKTSKDLSEFSACCIEAHVPGNFELDLFRAGIEPDPYFGDNIFKYYKYESFHLFYYRNFIRENSKDCNLHFDGIDTIADVFVNGTKVLSSENMMMEYSVGIGQILKKENEILVHIKPFVIESRKYKLPMRSMYNTAYGTPVAFIRKPAFMFGWDLMPRAVSGGIFKSCYLTEKKEVKIEDICYFADKIDTVNKTAALNFVYNLTVDEDDLSTYSIEIEGECGESKFFCTQKLWHTSGMFFHVAVTDCHFWYPKNYGEPELYRVRALLKKAGRVVDEYRMSIGIREVELVNTEVLDDDGNGSFYFKVNGKNVFVLGTNWTPLDCYKSKDEEKILTALEYVNDLGCNMIRCWGGNSYEGHTFFDYCDEHGIMVWQDFSFACGLYPYQNEFLEKVRAEAEFIVKKLRNHPSLCLWAGDNECDLFSMWFKCDPNDNIITRKVLRDVIAEHDHVTPYLPSSPYYSEKAFLEKRKTTETHTWGDRCWFKGDFYKDDPACFQSEIGYPAISSPQSLKKYISEDKLFPWKDEKLSKKYNTTLANSEWAAHTPNVVNEPSDISYMMPLNEKHIKNLFGTVPEDLNTYVMMSQISQAEAFKYFIERQRIRKSKKSGIIWWNLIDGFPINSNAVITYDLLRKLAYFYIRRSQLPVAMMMDEPKDGYLELYAVNDSETDEEIIYQIENVSQKQILAEGICFSKKAASVAVTRIVNPQNDDFLLIRYCIGGKEYVNHFTCNMPSISFEKYIAALRESGLAEFEGFA